MILKLKRIKPLFPPVKIVIMRTMANTILPTRTKIVDNFYKHRKIYVLNAYYYVYLFYREHTIVKSSI